MMLISCSACPAGCQDCTSAASCTSCALGHFLQAGLCCSANCTALHRSACATQGATCGGCASNWFGAAAGALPCAGDLDCTCGRTHSSAVCDCNNHGTGACDSISGDCSCTHNTTGNHCEQCQPRFFGSPLNGGSCSGLMWIERMLTTIAACPAACDQCSSVTTCSVCAAGRVLNAGACCTADCASLHRAACDAANAACGSCQPGWSGAASGQQACASTLRD